jgi:hypothetical protein
VLDGGHQTRRNELLQRAARPEQVLGRMAQVPANGSLERIRIQQLAQPLVRASAKLCDPVFIQRFGQRFVFESLRQVGQDPSGFLLEFGGLHGPEDLSVHLAQDVLYEPSHLRQSGLRQEIRQGGLLSLYQLHQQLPDSPVESLTQLLVLELGRHVLRREERVADHLADRAGEALLVLGDRTLQPTDRATEQVRRLVRVEQHPHGDPIRQSSGQRAEHERQQGLDPVEAADSGKRLNRQAQMGHHGRGLSRPRPRK